MFNVKERLGALVDASRLEFLRGIERESLRVTREGDLATTPHPVELGAALTHSHITTDFSESQLELITGAQPSVPACVDELTEIHQFVYRHLGDEMLWSSSMPCSLPPDDQIPIGQYGRSNIGRLKSVYRSGLSRRYGRRMQTISGVHYNFSLSEAAMAALQQSVGDVRPARDFRTEQYFALIRNFRRNSWLPLYLFGASPAVCKSFVEGRNHRLVPLSEDTLYLPYATSLRMGPLGYQSDAQRSLAVSYNCLESYAGSLHHALTEPYAQYEAIGVLDGSGGYRQLSTTLLQIENEFYGTIRPKRRVRRGERPLHALTDRGVEYVEVRSLDVDPFSTIGVDPMTMRFLDVFLLYCLLAESPPDTPAEIQLIAQNQYRVAERGREPGLRLSREGVDIELIDWGRELVALCEPIADALDAASDAREHRRALSASQDMLRDVSRTPSARVLTAMRDDHADSFVAFALARSLAHRQTLLATPLSTEAAGRLARMADESLARQRDIEASDDVSFEEYRKRYLALDVMSGLRPTDTRPV